jgi:hypothetical protein
MRSSLGSTAFQMFDKIVVAVLVLLTIFYLAITFVEEPKVTIDRAEVDRLIGQIKLKQDAFKHKPTPLVVDYLTAAVGDFHPDASAVRPRDSFFTPKRKDDSVDPPLPSSIVLIVRPGDTRLSFASHSCPKKLLGSEVKIAAGGEQLITAVLENGRLKITAKLGIAANGKTQVQLVKDGKVGATVEVNIKFVPDVAVEDIPAPKDFIAKSNKSQVPLTWKAAVPNNATIKRYVVLRAEGERPAVPYVAVPIPEKLEKNKELSALYVADNTPAPSVFWDGTWFVLVDQRLQGGMTYTYQVRAEGIGTRTKKTIEGKVSKPQIVKIVELFKLRFFSLGRQAVTIEVSKVHTRKDGESVAVFHRFTPVERGQSVGWKLPRVSVPNEVAAKNVDLGTGYQVLDILNNERYIRREDKDADGNVKRQWENTQQKVLLIGERGRIKVLTPSQAGQP